MCADMLWSYIKIKLSSLKFTCWYSFSIWLIWVLNFTITWRETNCYNPPLLIFTCFMFFFVRLCISWRSYSLLDERRDNIGSECVVTTQCNSGMIRRRVINVLDHFNSREEINLNSIIMCFNVPESIHWRRNMRWSEHLDYTVLCEAMDESCLMWSMVEALHYLLWTNQEFPKWIHLMA